jgi:colanic acid biosynthesis protein WcaH
MMCTEPKPGEWLKPEDFDNVVRLTPLVAIDLIIRAADGRVLVGRRVNEPARSTFFVPGSRISKNERLAAAFKRICREELGIERDIAEARFVGVYEHLYQTNRSGKPGFGTHYVTLAYELQLDGPLGPLPDDQHGEFAWKTPSEILASPEVHENTQAYFKS